MSAKRRKTRKTEGQRKTATTSRPGGQPANGKLKPIRAGTMNARVVEMAATGRFSFAEIGAKLGIEATYARAWMTQSSRRNGIGYAVGDDGKVRAAFPKGKTVKDAIKDT